MAYAQRHPRLIGRLAARLAGRPDLGADSQLAAGWALLRWERLEPAEAALGAALADPNGLPAELAHAARRARLLVRQLRGEGPRLQNLWEAQVAACAATGHWAEAARARCEQVAHLNLLGRPGPASDLAAHAATLVAAYGTPDDQAHHQHVAGVAATNCGELEAAQALLDAAAAGFARLGYRAEQARVHFSRAWLWQRREQFAAAAADLEQALAAFTALDLPFRVALCQRDLGIVARHRGDYGRAIALTVTAREQFLALGRPDRAASCDFNLGVVAHVSGMHDLAIGVYRRAQQAYSELGDTAHALLAGRNQALALRAQGRPQAALALIEQIAPTVDALGDHLEHAELRSARAQALRDLGRPAEASAELRAAHAIFQRLGNRPAAGECLLDLARLDLERGAPGQAMARLQAALEALHDRPAHLWQIQYLLGRAAELGGDRPTARDHYLAAAQTVARIRRRLASEHASSGVFGLAEQLHADALRLAAAIDDRAQMLTLAEYQRGLLADPPPPPFRATPHRLRAQLARAGAELRQALHGPPDGAPLEATLADYVHLLMQTRHAAPLPALAPRQLDIAQVRARLSAIYGAGWTALVPVFAGDQLLLLGLTATTIELTRLDLDAALRDLINRACLPGYRQMTYRNLAHLRDPSRPAWEVLAGLGRLLLPGWLRSRLGPDHRLLIVPSGPLHALAWAALRLDDGWLCERAIIELLPGLDVAAAAGRPTEPGPALLVGCADFSGRAAPLPQALRLLDDVERLWPGPSRRLAGPAATCRAVRELSAHGELQRCQLIHIASHAQLGAADGLLAHIKLADEDLMLDEIAQLRLGGALVVLAVCEGGAGAVLPGDEVLGLSRALLMAGAGGVVACLWPIYDRSAPELFARIYGQFAASGDMAAAITLAQRAMLAHQEPAGHPDTILNTPYIWGGFALMVRGGYEAAQGGPGPP